jgi:hypothetical protein
MALRTYTRESSVGDLTAAVDIDLSKKVDQGYARSTSKRSRYASSRSWDWYNCIGEVHYAISRSARIAGYADLQCVTYDDKGEIDDVVDDGLPAEFVREISSPFGGTRGLIERFYTLMKVPADSYLLEVLDDEGDLEGYHFMSPDELDLESFSRWKRGPGVIRWITVPASDGNDGNAFTRDVNPSQMLGRVWTPNKRFIDETDSALRALDSECEALYLLTKTIKSKLQSRFALAGIMYLPTSISTARVTKNQTQVAGQEIDSTLDYIIAAMTRNVTNWEDAKAAMPILLRGNNDDGDRIRHIVMDREVFETDLKLRAELIGRILQGLDQNQDTTRGTADQSHFSAWAASDEERRVAVQPDLETMCWALTRLVLHRRLEESGMGPEDIMRYGVSFDLSRAATRSNQQEDARQLRDRGLISEEASLVLSGIDPKDKLQGDELIRWVGLQTKNAKLMLHGIPEADDLDWDEIQGSPIPPGPAPASPADDPEAGPGGGGSDGSPDNIDTDTPRTQRPA